MVNEGAGPSNKHNQGEIVISDVVDQLATPSTESFPFIFALFRFCGFIYAYIRFLRSVW